MQSHLDFEITLLFFKDFVRYETARKKSELIKDKKKKKKKTKLV